MQPPRQLNKAKAKKSQSKRRQNVSKPNFDKVVNDDNEEEELKPEENEHSDAVHLTQNNNKEQPSLSDISMNPFSNMMNVKSRMLLEEDYSCWDAYVGQECVSQMRDQAAKSLRNNKSIVMQLGNNNRRQE